MNKDQLHPKREFKSIRHIVEYAAKTYGNRIAFSYRQKPHDEEKISISYIEFRDDVRALATEMLSRGMNGKHVVVVAKMSYDFIVTYYATLSSEQFLFLSIRIGELPNLQIPRKMRIWIICFVTASFRIRAMRSSRYVRSTHP